MKVIHAAQEPEPFLSAGESMMAGNTVAGHNSVAFSGPGSESALPIPDALDQLVPVTGPQQDMVPDIHESGPARVEGHPDSGAALWKDPGYQDEGSVDRWGWRET